MCGDGGDYVKVVDTYVPVQTGAKVSKKKKEIKKADVRPRCALHLSPHRAVLQREHFPPPHKNGAHFIPLIEANFKN